VSCRVAGAASYGAPVFVLLAARPVIGRPAGYVLKRARIVPALLHQGLAFIAATAYPMASATRPCGSALMATAIHREQFTAHRSLPAVVAFIPRLRVVPRHPRRHRPPGADRPRSTSMGPHERATAAGAPRTSPLNEQQQQAP